jgi:phosphopantothenoylcysteine decarboxylase/phosphopantothenate--cysteine ligase
MLQGKKILIGITAGIAAYKIPLLIRLLKKAGAEVQIILTPNAKDFVTPLTLATLSGKPVHTGFFDAVTGEWDSHVDLGLWADLFLIAPATVNSMAKMAHGIADNFLLTVYLSARCKIMIAPAMDLDMYKHPSTKQNLQILEARGHQMIAPTKGELASGLCGEGRMEEPQVMFDLIQSHFKLGQRFFGKRVLISAGPTYEAIDPVRFIGNYSSGKMGVALAQTFAEQGASVDLVLGPTSLNVNNSSIAVYPVTTAEEMYQNCLFLFEKADIAIMSAAVADYKPKQVAEAKIKKNELLWSLELERTHDILKALGQKKTVAQFLVGFALETDHGIENAIQKLRNKNLDLIVLNQLSDAGAGFMHDTNKVTLIDADEKTHALPLKSKKEVAADIAETIAGLLFRKTQ